MPLDKRSTFTFSAPFSVSGVTLPAGSYVFRLANDLGGRDVVQVLGARDGTVHAMFFTLPTPRRRAATKAEIRFMETASDAPLAIRSWRYAGEAQGYEAVRPSHRRDGHR
jgi:hypothetical protein